MKTKVQLGLLLAAMCCFVYVIYGYHQVASDRAAQVVHSLMEVDQDMKNNLTGRECQVRLLPREEITSIHYVALCSTDDGGTDVYSGNIITAYPDKYGLSWDTNHMDVYL